MGGTVGPFVLGKDPGNRQFGIAWGTVALPIVKAGVDALGNGGMNMVCCNFTATEICSAKGNTSCVYPLVTSTPLVSISTDDTGLLADLIALLADVVPPMVG